MSETPADEAIRLAGQFDRLGDKVPRGFLRVVSDVSAEIPNEQSGRLQLAQWLTDTDDGAGRLAARVLANRIWYHMIGRGIVRTVDNFRRTVKCHRIRNCWIIWRANSWHRNGL